MRDEAAKSLGAATMINKIVTTGYKELQLIHYFTAGEDEVKCWTIREGTKAPGAASVIHTDFERGFIKAEVIHWDELLDLGSWTKAKEVGKVRIEGKEYHPADGDVMEFRFNV